VKTYIHLEQGRLGSDFSMDVKIEEDLDIQQVVIAVKDDSGYSPYGNG